MPAVEERILSWSHGEPSHQNRGTKLLTRQGGRTDVREEKNRGERKKGLFLRGVFLRHKGHTIGRPLNLVCSLEIKGPAVVGTAPVAQGPELRRNT